MVDWWCMEAKLEPHPLELTKPFLTIHKYKVSKKKFRNIKKIWVIFNNCPNSKNNKLLDNLTTYIEYLYFLYSQ